MLNLPAFHTPGEGFDFAAFARATAHAALAMTLLSPASPTLGIGFTDLAGVLADLGLDYDSDAARSVAAAARNLLRQ